ncbi:MAG: ABC-type transport auxiliary lipoprotein family protein [Rhodospirillaceae bacterium]|nr:ABC-type transport auxiliary lipoprotein family protein [Rhodospirillaceae bacterium]
MSTVSAMTVPSRRAVLKAGLVLPAVLSACAADPVPLDTYYRLQPTMTYPPRPGGPLPGTAEVAPLRGEGIINSRAILYRISASELRQYTYHFWTEAPAAMLQRALIDALRGGRAFDQVVSPEMRMARNYEVLGSLRTFEHDTSGNERVLVALELGVRKLGAGSAATLKSYAAEEACADGSVAAAVRAFSQSFDRIAAEFINDLGTIG